MNDMEFSFGPMPWEEELSTLQAGDTLSAARFLALMEVEDPLTVEEALSFLDERKITLDISDLPPAALTGPAALRLKQEAQLHTPQQVIQGLDANDPLKLYLQELAAMPAAGDPQLLAERYRSGEHHVAEQLVNVCLSLVVETAMEYTGRGVLLLDLIQEGSLGLWQSIMGYDSGDFTAHAGWWIRHFMAKAVTVQARSSGAGQKLRQDMEDFLDADQRLLAELGRNPTLEEIAQLLHITAEEAATLEKMVATARNMERTHAQQQEPEPTEEDNQAVEDTAYFQIRQHIMELLSTLSEQDAKLLTLRFGLEGGRPLSPVQTGEKLGMTPEEVVRREAAALSQLRGN